MHVLITAGPTREHLDDVRFLTNASSGRMGYALAASAVAHGWQVTLVSGPVTLSAPAGVEVRRVTSAVEMFDVCLELLPRVDGVIAVAAVSDYRPAQRMDGKIHRSANPLRVELVPNPDILAELGRRKTHQWSVGFAVEAADLVERARAKMVAKLCDAIIVNRTDAMESANTSIQLIARPGVVALEFHGAKELAADRIIEWIATSLASRPC
jgi:phosphopantothenoylcysteine decarboxylase/phosphopantothenate--cysteine ligase